MKKFNLKIFMAIVIMATGKGNYAYGSGTSKDEFPETPTEIDEISREPSIQTTQSEKEIDPKTVNPIKENKVEESHIEASDTEKEATMEDPEEEFCLHRTKAIRPDLNEKN